MDQLHTHEWITLASCACQLALASIALVRLTKSPLAGPLLLLCLDFFAFNAADVAGCMTGGREWELLDSAAASLLCPIALHFARVFVGRSQPMGPLFKATVVYFSVISAVCAAPFLGVHWVRDFAGSKLWVLAITPVALVTIVAFFFLLISHLRQATAPIERARTWLVIAAFLVGTAGNLFDLSANVGLAVPRLGPLGTLMATLLLATVALGLGLFQERMSPLLIANGVAAGTLQVSAYLALFYSFGGNLTLFTLSAVTLTFALAPAGYALYRAGLTQRKRLEYHATLGRFASQMAHDLRNPLSAIKGAAEFLDVERARGAPFESAAEYLQLIQEQADRLDRVIANYQRLGRVEPVLAPLDVNELVASLFASQSLAAPSHVRVVEELAKDLPPCRADSDLLAGAIENLIRNSFEAMPGGGTLTLRTTSTGYRGSEHRSIVIAVVDTGAGMDARTRDRLFSAFFTTKTTGSGLGLSFVRRVIQAHGGSVTIESAEGLGTTVRLKLPASA